MRVSLTLRGLAQAKPQDSLRPMREHIQRLQKREAHLQKVRPPPAPPRSHHLRPRSAALPTAQQINQQMSIARAKTKAKDKRGALMALKKKKLLDKEIGTIQATTFTMEQQCMMLEQAVTQVETVSAMKQGQQAMAAQQAKMGGIDAVEDVMDDIAEQQQDQEEITDALAQGIGGGLMGLMDDDELLGELDELEAEDLDAQLLDLGPVASGPVAGVAAPAAAETGGHPAPVAAAEDEDEMAMLMAQMAPG